MLVHSHIGYGSPVEDSPKAHGEPLGVDAVKATKRVLRPARRTPTSTSLTASASTSRPASAQRGLDARTAWEATFERLPRRLPGAGGRDRAHAARDAARRLGERAARRSRPTRRASPAGTPPAQVLNAVARHVPWLLGGVGRPHPVHQDAPGVRRRRRLPARRPRRAATCTSASGSTPRRRSPTGMALTKLRPYWSGVPDLLRLRARRDAAVRADGDPGPAHLHPRLHRGGRGRAHPPAGRAACLAAGHARPAGLPARRRERGGRDVARRDRAAARARRAGALPPGPADPGPLGPRAGVGRGQGGLRPGRGQRRAARCDPARHRLRGAPGPRGPRRARRRTASARGWSACPAGSCSTGSRRSTATRCCPAR